MWPERIAMILLSLALPVLWGVFVNWAFKRVRSRRLRRHDDDTIFPDYQI